MKILIDADTHAFQTLGVSLSNCSMILEQAFEDPSSKASYSLLDLLFQYTAEDNTTGFESTDARVMVFALFSMAGDLISLGLKDDYSKPVEEVYMNTTKALIQLRGLAILEKCLMREETTHLPSWVPNFSVGSGPMGVNADWYYSASRTSRPSATFEGQSLHLDGFQVDTIVCSSPTLSAPHIQYPFNVPHGADVNRTYNQATKAFNRWFEGFENMIYDSGLSRDDPSILDAIWMVPIMDYTLDRVGHQSDQSRIFHNVQASRTTYESYCVFHGLCKPPVDCKNEESWYKEQSWPYILALWRLEYHYRGFLTSNHHYIGLGPETAQTGDAVVIFLGAKVPFILREIKPGTYRIVGPCYVHGIMKGELMDTTPRFQTFIIH